MAIATWDRLVRYVSEKDGKTRYGEPIVSGAKPDIDQLAQDGKLKVKVFEGPHPWAVKATGEEDSVKSLLGPMTVEEVPIIRCVGLNYKTHILETGSSIPKNPVLFTKPGPAVADTRAPVPIPPIAQAQCDYEGELTVVIGRDCKNVSADKALDYVLGYVSGNDVSCRDWQMDKDKAGAVPQFSFSKSFDKYCPLGPCIVSPKLLKDAGGLDLKTYVNGELRQSSNTSDLVFGVKDIIAFCSQGQTLQAGSLIMTGTPAGVALAMKPPRWLKDGDEVVVDIEGIGKLVNTMQFE